MEAKTYPQLNKPISNSLRVVLIDDELIRAVRKINPAVKELDSGERLTNLLKDHKVDHPKYI
jgi:hypothetical protein